MKTLKFLGSTVLICLFVVACAKTKKEEQARIAGDDKGTVGTESTPGSDKPTFDITKEGYNGKTLVLQKVEPGAAGSKGKIEIDGKDAMELYERMRIKAELADGSQLDTRYTTHGKAGKNLSCFEYQLVESKDKAPAHTCVIQFDSRSGKVLQNKEVTLEEKIVEKATEYKGTLLTITPNKGKNADKSESTASLTIVGKDAKALFDTLSAEAKSPIVDSKKGTTLDDGWNQMKVKTGTNIRCYEEKNPKTDAAPIYSCSLSIDANDGTVKASDLSTAAAATPDDKSTPAEATPDDGKAKDPTTDGAPEEGK